MRTKSMIIMVAVALLLGMANWDDLAQAAPAAPAPAPNFQKVLEGAKREGKLVLWVSTPAREKTHRLLLEAFNKRFGLQTRWEWIPIHPSQAVPRLIAEASAGKVTTDLASLNINKVMGLFQVKLVKPYPWVQVFESTLPGINIPAEFAIKELRGTGLSWFDNAYGIAWNTKMIKDNEIPNSLDQLNNVKWQGKLLLNIGDGGPFDMLSLAVGREKILDLVKKIMSINPILKNGTPAVTAALTVGEAPVAVSSFFNSERSARNGEPVKFKFFEDYIAVGLTHIYVPEASPNPNTARLFAAWAATEGVQIFEQEEIGGRVNDPRSKVARLIKEQAGKAKLVFPKTVKEIGQVQSIGDEIVAILTSGR